MPDSTFRFKSFQLNRKSSARILLYVLFLIGACAAQIHALNNGYNGKFWIFAFFAIVICMLYQILNKKKNILSIHNDKEREWEIARLKLEAEKISGIALIFAIGMFYQYGFDIDKSFIEYRFHQAVTINYQVHQVMTETFCSVVSSRNHSCDAIRTDLDEFLKSFYTKNGEPTRIIANRLIDRLKNQLDIPPDSDQARAFEPALNTLKSFDVTDGVLNLIAKSFPIISVLLGSFAISSKIAVAQVDFDGKNRKKKEDSQPAKY